LPRTLAAVPPDFFNSREDVLMIYSAVFVAFAVMFAPGLAVGVVRTALSPSLVRVFALALLPPAAFVFLAYRMAWWHTSTLKETIYWFTGTGIVLVADAISRSAPDGLDLFPRVLPRIFGVTLAIECAANLFAFPFVVELALVTLILVCSAFEEFSKLDADTLKLAGFFGWVIAVIGFAYLGNFLVHALTDLDAFLSRDTAEDFLIGPVLTLAVIPVLYVVSWVSRRQVQALRLNRSAT
jgi:hypothetical protein